jgi:hypothetical protein
MGEDRIVERPGTVAAYWIVPIVLATEAAWLLRLLVEWPVRMRHDGIEKTFARADISAVFVEDDHFVLLGARRRRAGVRLQRAARGRARLGVRAARLPVARRRPAPRRLPQVATRRGDRLRLALGELGVIVRDDGKRQYWRLTGHNVGPWGTSE